MRLAVILLFLAGILLIAVGRHLIRRARKHKFQNPALSAWRPRLTGWSLTVLGTLAFLLAAVIW